MTRDSCRAPKDSTVSSNHRMIGIIQTIRFSVFVLLIVTVVVGSEAHENKDGGGSLAYSSASASANAFTGAGANTFALSNANAFTGIGDLPGTIGGHDGHKGIRSYDNTGYGGNNQANGGVKGSRAHGCTKCKWEDDDYWEKDEEEIEPEEKDEDDCYDGDDGQYKEHDHGHHHRNKGESPPTVQKLGAANPIGQGPYTGVGSSANAAGNANSGAPTGTGPIKAGHPQIGSPSSGLPWNKTPPVSGRGTYGPGQPTNQQVGPGWQTGSGTPSKPNWNEAYGGSTSGTGSHPSGSWNGAIGSGPNMGISQPHGGSWKNGPETGSGCSGNYQPGTDCAQGLNNAGPVKQSQIPSVGINIGNVRKENAAGYSTVPTAEYNPQGSPSACSGNPYGSCTYQPADQKKPHGSPVGPSGPTTGPGQYFGNPSGPSFGPGTGQGHSPVSYSRSPGNSGNIGRLGSLGNTGYSTGSQSPNGVANAVSSSIAYAGTGPAISGNGRDSGHPTGNAPASGSPFGNAQSPGSPRLQNGNIPYGTGKPSPSVIKGSPVGHKPHTPDSGIGATQPSYPPSSHDNTGPIKPAHKSNLYDISGATNPSNQPGPYGGPDTTKSSNQPSSYGGPDATKSSNQPGSYTGTRTTGPSYQPGPYGGPGTTKSPFQPSPYGNIGTTKPSYQPGPHYGPDETKSSSNQPGTYGIPGITKPNQPNLSDGCTSGPENCGNRRGCNGGTSDNGSPENKPCGQQNNPPGINKSSGPIGSFPTFPNDISQSSQQIVPAVGSRPFNGFPTGGGNSPHGCTAGSGVCVPSSGIPAYPDNVNKISGKERPYQSNLFLTGKIPSPSADGPSLTTIDSNKPIGYGNPFLQGTVQPGNSGIATGAQAWSHADTLVGTNPSTNDKNMPSIGAGGNKHFDKNNPFLNGSGPKRGDIGIDSNTAPTSSGSFVPNADNTKLSQTNEKPTFNDKSQGENARPSDHYSGSSWNGGFSSGKNPSTANRGSGSGGGVGIGSDGFGNLGHDNGNAFGGAFSGAFSSAQTSGIADSKPGSHSSSGAPAQVFGQANSGSWASSGASAGSGAGSGSWSSSGASAYASSSASSWAGAGAGPSFVKG
ncbi:PREDICTED: hornerin-like isoform X2 [Eufriesea mexicana]|uniref:hornerin-like isoform X2 n=1 Tax=Eufriesea mexicana TaxID=516756 RepID=UPI00083C8F56|nr:PREDICTED: hornerin-like isoform X2 [Eufriesea mexicana]